MPKITLDIPEWAYGRHIHIFAGIELLAQMEFRRKRYRENGKTVVKEEYLPLKIKPSDGRCNGCGDCCSTGGPFISERLLEEVNKRILIDKAIKGGQCSMLGDNGCILGGMIPFGCVRSNCEGWSENCTEKLVDLEVL